MANQQTAQDLSPALGGQQVIDDTQSPRLGGDAALTHLIEALKDTSSEIRQRAVDALAEIGTEQVQDLLFEAMGDQDWSVRRRAVIGLSQLGGETVFERLAEILQQETTTPLAASAVQAVILTRNPRGIPIFFTLYFNGDYRFQAQMERNLNDALLIQPEAALPYLFHLLFDKERTHHATQMLRRMRYEVVIAALLEVVNDPNRDLYQRRAAIRGLSAVQAVQASPLLINLLRENGDLSANAARALKNVRDRAAIPELVELLKHPAGKIRKLSANILGSRKAKAAVPDLLNLLTDPNAEIRWEAVRALGRIRDARAVPGLRQLQGDRSQKVQKAVEQALGRIPDEEYIREMIEQARETNTRKRDAAFGILWQAARSPEFRPLLIPHRDEIANYVDHPAMHISHSAREILRRLG